MLKDLKLPKLNLDKDPFKVAEKVYSKISKGAQDQIDLISYSGLKEEAGHIQIGERYVRTLFISGYPHTASTGWLDSILNFTSNYDLSFHLEPVQSHLALPKLNRKITELESVRRSLLREGRIVGVEVTDPLESATELRDRIQRGQEKLFQASIYVTLRAKSLEELNKTTQLLESALAARLFYTRIATFQQLEGLQSILPRAEDQLKQRRNLDSSSAALTFPFASSDLAHESGILYGINRSSNSLVIIDRFLLNNANSIIFAQSGAGKSYTAKVEILRQLLRKTKVIVIDPEREYESLAKSVGGSYIRVSPSSEERINPLELVRGDKADLPEKIQDLSDLISLMADGLSSEEKAILDKAILKTYQDSGIFSKTKKVNSYPLLKDLAKTLKTLKQDSLVKRLEKYLTGSASAPFSGQTNIKLDNRLIVFDIKDLPDSLRPIMMMLIAGFVQNEVKKDPVKRVLVVDEAWKLLEHEETARFLSGMVRRARKYHLGVTVISQQASDFLSQKYGSVIASQSSLRILLRQDSTTINSVVEQFGLSELEKDYLLTCGKGEAIVIADRQHVAVKVVASQIEHPLISTDPSEGTWKPS
jgi:conjugal transfer ATP-binding protein TraC